MPSFQTWRKRENRLAPIHSETHLTTKKKYWLSDVICAVTSKLLGDVHSLESWRFGLYSVKKEKAEKKVE